MLKMKYPFVLAVLLPLLGTAAGAAKDSTAARAACFEQANAAVAALRADATPAEKKRQGR